MLTNRQIRAKQLRIKRQANRPNQDGARPLTALTANAEALGEYVGTMALNVLSTRAGLLEKLFDPRRDINVEAGYPATISLDQYRNMWARGMGWRVVNIWPEETWRQLPDVFETEDASDETVFEKAWDELVKDQHIYHYLERIDVLSGVGHYGILLIGLDDGKALDKPVKGINTKGEAFGTPGERKIIYIRALDESLARITSWEGDVKNPRFGLPTMYSIQLADPTNQPETSTTSQPGSMETKVHWSRVLHVADNRTTSEVMGTPRQQTVWNNLYDLLKVLAGSGEMYWKGGFPGISIETQPGVEDPDFDLAGTREAMDAYMNGLQRYISLIGMTAKSLAPQIADPTSTYDVHIKTIATIMGVPTRTLMGTEQGQLAGDQNVDAWDGRLVMRRERYVTPKMLRPFVQWCINVGVVPAPAEENGFGVKWPDAHSPSELEQAEVMRTRTEAYTKYTTSGMATLVPPLEFMTVFDNMTDEQAQAVIDAAVKHIEDKVADVVVPGSMPTPPELETDENENPEDEEEGVEVGNGKPPATPPPPQV